MGANEIPLAYTTYMNVHGGTTSEDVRTRAVDAISNARGQLIGFDTKVGSGSVCWNLLATAHFVSGARIGLPSLSNGHGLPSLSTGAGFPCKNIQ